MLIILGGSLERKNGLSHENYFGKLVSTGEQLTFLKIILEGFVQLTGYDQLSKMPLPFSFPYMGPLFRSKYGYTWNIRKHGSLVNDYMEHISLGCKLEK